MHDWVSIGDIISKNSNALEAKIEWFRKRKHIDCEIHGTQVLAMASGLECEACNKIRKHNHKHHEHKAHKETKLKELGIGETFWNANLDIATPEQNTIFSLLQKYTFDKNIILVGKTGTGKTYAAIALLIKALDLNKDCIFIKFYRLSRISYIKEDDFLQKIKNCHFLIIDDFGANPNDFKDKYLYEIYDYRLEHNLITVLTSNLTVEDLREKLSDVLYSRIRPNCLVYAFNGKDLRLSK